MNTEHIESRIWDYIDGRLSADEKSFVENLVKTDQVWREKYAELLQVHALMTDNFDLEQPSMSFTRNVMEEIGRMQITPAARKYINAKVIWGIGGFFVLSIVALIVYAFSQATWSTGSGSALPFNIESMNYDKLFNSAYINIFIMINIVLGLVVLDMYLTSRKKRWS